MVSLKIYTCQLTALLNTLQCFPHPSAWSPQTSPWPTRTWGTQRCRCPCAHLKPSALTYFLWIQLCPFCPSNWMGRARLGGDKKGAQGTELEHTCSPCPNASLDSTRQAPQPAGPIPALEPCPTAHKGHCPDPPRYPGLLVALAYTERLHPISSQLHFFTVTR